MCCEAVFDIYFPTYEFTERNEIQIDWEIPPTGGGGAGVAGSGGAGGSGGDTGGGGNGGAG